MYRHYFFLFTPSLLLATEQSIQEPSYFWTKFIVMVAVLFIAFQIMLIPEKRRLKETKALIDNLKKGDTLITTSGIVGEVEDIEGAYMTLKFPSGYSLVVLKESASMLIATDKFKKGGH